MFLSLHNSYDMPLKTSDLAAMGIPGEASPTDSVLSRALPIVEKAVFTVSGQFAVDLIEDPLQAEIMIPHLRGELATRLVGIDNGPFARSVLRQSVVTAAAAGRFEALSKWKAAQKRTALSTLEGLTASSDRPVWGDISGFTSLDEPWFVMGGRDDPRQKGYDVAAAAIDGFLTRGGRGQFVLFPVPESEGVAGLQFLRRLAEAFPERVMVMPFRWSEGFFMVLRGAAFGLMPSLYEPFGMANEFYLNGAAGIGRATGGITAQIVPVRTGASFNSAVARRSARVHAAFAASTGILYREADDIPSVTRDWRSMGACVYEVGSAHPDRLEARSAIPLFRAMASQLTIALSDASSIAERPDEYYPMLARGIEYVLGTFSWQRTAREYLRHIARRAR